MEINQINSHKVVKLIPLLKNFSFIGGETGIRTLGTFNSTHTFQACALNRSAISPLC